MVGDGAETATLILDQIATIPGEPLSLAEWVEGRILPLRQAPPDAQQRLVIGWIRELTRWERFTLFKLLTGELRLGVSQTLAVRAVAQAASLPATSIAARIMGEWTPSAAWYAGVVSPGVTEADRSRPYPFCLASPIDNTIADAAAVAALLGERGDWQVEWKWDGIRAQLIVRAGRVYLWSRGEELITDRFPEVAGIADRLRRRHRARRRDPGLARRSAACLRRAAAAHRPRTPGGANGARHPGRLHGLRHPRGRRRRSAADAADRAPGPPRSGRQLAAGPAAGRTRRRGPGTAAAVRGRRRGGRRAAPAHDPPVAGGDRGHVDDARVAARPSRGSAASKA